jgi:hypothetical protein
MDDQSEEDPVDSDNNNDADDDNDATEQQLRRMMQGLQTGFQNIGLSRQHKAKFVDLLSFKGGDQDPQDWLDRYNNACEANSISDHRRLTLVPSFLKGSALT